MTQAGNLRHRIEIQTLSSDRGDRGQRSGKWSTIKNVWASVRTLTGRESEQARQIYASATRQIEIRYTPGLTTENRLKLGSKIFNIGHINNIDERDVDLVLLCGSDE